MLIYQLQFSQGLCVPNFVNLPWIIKMSWKHSHYFLDAPRKNAYTSKTLSTLTCGSFPVPNESFLLHLLHFSHPHQCSFITYWLHMIQIFYHMLLCQLNTLLSLKLYRLSLSINTSFKNIGDMLHPWTETKHSKRGQVPWCYNWLEADLQHSYR